MTQTKNPFSLKYKAILTMLAAALFASCTNLVTRTPQDTIDGGGINQGGNSARGALTVTARVSGEASRYAMPTIPELVYAALLYKDGESPENENFEPGTQTNDEDGNIRLGFSFQRPDDTSGTFTLEVCAFVKADVVAEDGTKNFSRNSVFLSGYKDKLAIDDDSDEIEVDGSIALSFSEPETVNLKIKVPDGCTLTIDDTTHFAVTGASPDFTVKQTGTKISAGSYPVTFTVKKGDEIIHVFSEYINVINRLCTDTWSGLGRGEAKDVTNSISKTVYVRGAGGWYDTTYNDDTTAKADDDNLGSFSSPLATIQKAIDKVIAMNDGESDDKTFTIYIDGTLTQNTVVNHMARIVSSENLNLTIESLSANTEATLDAANNGRVIYTSGKVNVKLKNIHITGGNATENGGGGIYTYGDSVTVELFNVTISNCTTTDGSGGGIFNNSGTLKMTGGAITGCNAGATDSGKGGGGIYNGGTFNLSGVAISGCSAGAYGGGILTRGSSSAENLVKDCTITDCNVQGTTANNYGGGICVYTGSLTVEGGTISECVAKGSGSGCGGGVIIFGGSASAEIKGCTITGCKAMNGGGINNYGTLKVTEGTSISDCTGYGAVFNWKTLIVTGGTKIFDCTNAGGIYNSTGSLTVDGCTISNCMYSSFGGIYITNNSTFAKISNCTITDCHANATTNNEGSGGINNELASTEVEGCTITNCTASHNGGGIYNDVSDDTVATKITNCTISGCKAKGTTSKSGGGGIYVNSGKLELTNVNITGGNDVEDPDARCGGGVFVNVGMLTMNGGEISDCTANNSGGGVYVYNGTFTMSGGELTGNIASSSFGGGVYISKDGTFTMEKASISGCKATGGGGIYNEGKLTVESGTKISGCRGSFWGGGICNAGTSAVAEISGCTIESCNTTSASSNTGGGGIYNSGTLTVSGCTFTLCTTTVSGGGIRNNGELIVSNTSFTTCSADNKGGGIYNNSSGTVTPTNITYSGCTAPTDSDKSGF